MSDRHDFELILDSGVPLVVVETTDEPRVLAMLSELAVSRPASSYRPLFRWTVTDGLQRLDLQLEPQRHNAEPEEVLRHIRAVDKPGIYALLDFHPFLNDPVNIRLLKDIAISAANSKITVVLIGHRVELPRELERMSAQLTLRLPDAAQRAAIVEACIRHYETRNPGGVRIDREAFELLVKNLNGLTHADTERLARHAIHDDGAITADDVPSVMQAKYRLLSGGGVLSFEYDVTPMAELAGFRNLKTWLAQRRAVFRGEAPAGLDVPRGLLLIGVQGCGKSLAAKAAASAFGIPLLRLDFAALYNKYHGETERNLRESLRTAETMAPCALWIDEIEKGVATGHDDSGTARRVLGSLLTWMAERRAQVFIVATANDVHALPPELVRKGRFDEVFFVDLPSAPGRADILAIHLRKRGVDPARIDVPLLVALTEGFSGAEIEQGIVAGLFTAYAMRTEAETAHFAHELRKTRPLSVLMAERVAHLREWAKNRTVPAE